MKINKLNNFLTIKYCKNSLLIFSFSQINFRQILLSIKDEHLRIPLSQREAHRLIQLHKLVVLGGVVRKHVYGLYQISLGKIGDQKLAQNTDLHVPVALEGRLDYHEGVWVHEIYSSTPVAENQDLAILVRLVLENFEIGEYPLFLAENGLEVLIGAQIDFPYVQMTVALQ